MRMEIFGPLLLSFIAGLSTILGSILIFIKFKKVGEVIVFSLSFSFGIMILISIFHLIPDSSIILINNYGIYYGLIIIFLIFMLGYLSINKIDKSISNKNSSLYRVGLLSFISLILHNFPEGIAVFIGAISNINIGIKLCLGIMLHNIPEGIIISMPLYYSGVSKKKVISYTMLSGLSEPVGALLSYIFLYRYINNVLLSYILIFVSGLMISLSINNILKEALKYNKKQYILYGIIVSIVIFFILNLVTS